MVLLGLRTKLNAVFRGLGNSLSHPFSGPKTDAWEGLWVVGRQRRVVEWRWGLGG